MSMQIVFRPSRSTRRSHGQRLENVRSASPRLFVLLCVLSMLISALPQAALAQEEQPNLGSYTIFLPLTTNEADAYAAFISPDENFIWAEYSRLVDLVDQRLTLNDQGMLTVVPELSPEEIGTGTTMYSEISALIDAVNTRLQTGEMTLSELRSDDGGFNTANLLMVLPQAEAFEPHAVESRSAVSVPYRVGEYKAAHDYCDRLSWLFVPLAATQPILKRVGWIAALVGSAANIKTLEKCHRHVDQVKTVFQRAYRESVAANPAARPGEPINDVHVWRSVLIQDFVEGDWGNGAIIKRSQGGPKPHYVGGRAWYAYTRSANAYGVFPGYPINTQHQWGRVMLQDFREGSWGTGAIFVNMAPGLDNRQRAFLVAGNHWRAYVDYRGQDHLGHPTGFVRKVYNSNDRGYWWVQYFEDGEIWEQNGVVKVLSHRTWQWRYFHY